MFGCFIKKQKMRNKSFLLKKWEIPDLGLKFEIEFSVRKMWDLIRCGTGNMLKLPDDIPPQGEQPTFISIVPNKTVGFTML